MKVRLPILAYSETGAALLDLDIEVSLDESDVKEMVFYNIDCLASYFEDGKEYCVVFSAGEQFTSNLTMDQVEELIEKNSR
jgi:hypothetical protein